METDKETERKIFNKWKRARRLNEKAKNSEVSKKLNRFLITKDTKEKLNLMDEAISLLEGNQEQPQKVQNEKEPLLENLGISENDELLSYQVFYKLCENVGFVYKGGSV